MHGRGEKKDVEEDEEAPRHYSTPARALGGITAALAGGPIEPHVAHASACLASPLLRTLPP